MTTSIIVTIIGPDRPGLVSAISDKAAEFDANWADSLMANLAGQFAGIVHLQAPDQNSEALMTALRKLASPGMQIIVAAGGSITGNVNTRRLKLNLLGQDRPGIIRRISNQLAQRGISIDKLQTQIVSGAMSGEQMFQMHAQLTVPENLDDDELRRGLEGLANELMVDLELDDSAR